MTRLLRRGKRALLPILAALAGASISGCNVTGSLAMYGVPPALFISGKITKSDGTPIAGIQVAVEDQNPNNTPWPGAVTDANGRYEFQTYFAGGETVTITATDQDGPDSGGDFATTTKTLAVPPMQGMGEKSENTVNFSLDVK